VDGKNVAVNDRGFLRFAGGKEEGRDRDAAVQRTNSWGLGAFGALIGIARKCFGDRECICRYSGGQTLIGLTIARQFRFRRLARHVFPMRRGSGVRSPWIGIAGVRGMLLDAETRRRGGRRGERHFRMGFCAGKATQESQERRARRQQRVWLRRESSRCGGRMTNAGRANTAGRGGLSTIDLLKGSGCIALGLAG
jgi:hypothetical protein